MKRRHALANVASLSVELLARDADGKPVPPSEFRIFRAGMNESTKGIFKFSASSAEQVMKKAAAYGNEFAIDYAHGMFAYFAVDPAEAGKAAGWFKPEVRAGELWASAVRWTRKATSMLEELEYRYISPAFEHSDDGEITSLRNVALTNIPALHELEPLVASRFGGAFHDVEEDEENAMNWKQLLAMLSLPETATEAEAMAALSRLSSPTVELLSLTGKASASEAIGVVKAWKLAADSVPAMHAELSQVREAQLSAKRDALIADGKRRGVVPPSYEPVLKTMELAQLEALLKVAVPVHAPQAGEPSTVTHQTVALSQEDRQVAAMLGVSEADFAKRKAARAGVVPVQLSATAEDKGGRA